MRLGRALVAVVRFWIDFIIGDDWVVAAVVGGALLATWALTQADIVAWWLLPVAVIAVTGISLRRAVNRDSSHL